MLERPALGTRENLLINCFRMLGLAQNHPTARSAQRLMRGRRDDLGVGDGGRVHPTRYEPGEMRHVDNEYCADFIGDRAQNQEIHDPGIRAAATDDDPWLLFFGDVPHFVVINPSGLFVNVIRRRLEERAREIDGRAMGEMPAMRQRQAEQRVAELRDGEIRRHVRLRPGVRLHIRMLGAEQRLRPINRELLDLIHDLAPAVVALPRQPLGVLVRERRAHRFQNRNGNKILRGYELQAVLLPRDLFVDELANLGVDFREWRLPISHCLLLPAPCSVLRAPCSSHLSIFSTRLACRPPSNAVSNQRCRILTPCCSLTNCAGSTRTFEFPCSRDNSAICSFHASAARTWGKRLAAYDMPKPVPQVSTPRCTLPVLTALATGLA